MIISIKSTFLWCCVFFAEFTSLIILQALAKYMTDTMKESRIPDILIAVRHLGLFDLNICL